MRRPQRLTLLFVPVVHWGFRVQVLQLDPVGNQSLAMLYRFKALYQCLSCRALIFILIGVEDKGILINLQGLVAVPSAL